MTIECDRDDCAIEHGPVSSTLISYNNLYDKHGNELPGINPNTYTFRKSCHTCGRKWSTSRCERFGVDLNIEIKIA